MGTLVFQANLGGAINLIGPNTASTVNFTLPSADGTNGQAMVTNGSGTLSFATISTAAATPTVLGTVYGKMTTSGASPYLTAAGYNAGNATTGIHNTVFGYNVLNTNVTGTYNTGIGSQALASNTGSRNTAVGATVMRVTTGSENVGVGTEDGGGGYSPFWSNTSGSYNIAVGNGGLGKNTTGANNTAIGHTALYNNTTANNNTAVGYQALYNNSTGANNVAIGKGAAYGNSYTANANVCIGDSAGQALTTGSSNVFIGSYNSSTADYSAGTAINTGYNNVFVGTGVANNATTANNNTGIGYRTFLGLTTGSTNIALGNLNAGTLTTGSANTYIGNYVNASGAAVSAEILIGTYNSTGKGGSTGFINPSGGGVYQGNNSSTWSTTSDRRLKKNIVDNNVGLEKLTQIQVRNFEYRLPEEVEELESHCAIDKAGVQLGVIAQELQQILPDCVKQETTGVLSVDPDNLTWYTINAIKQLKAELDAAKAEIALLKGN
jgi:hypothetical protein